MFSGVVLLLAGCTSNPGFVGGWHSESLPGELADEMAALAMDIREGGPLTLTAMDLDGSQEQQPAMRKPVAEKEIVLTNDHRSDPAKAVLI